MNFLPPKKATDFSHVLAFSAMLVTLLILAGSFVTWSMDSFFLRILIVSTTAWLVPINWTNIKNLFSKNETS